MTTSPNLGITHIAASQTQKEVPANNAFNRLDAALTENVDISVSAGNATVTAAQAQQAIRLRATGATVAGRTVTLPAIKRMLVLMNSAASTQSVGFVRGTTTVNLAPGAEAWAYIDGTANGLETVDGIGGGGGGALLAANNLADLPNAGTARTNLGGTTTGNAVFTAASASAARTALGSTSTGDAIFTAANAGAARTSLGSTTTGDALFTAANAAAARTAIGATTTGSNLITAADATAARSAISAADVANAPRLNSTASNPTVSDDGTAGYAVGSEWINTTTQQVFVCISAATGAAVWQPIAASDHPGYISGGIYPLHPATATPAAPGAVDIVYLAPFILRRAVTNPQFGMRVAAAGTGSSFKIGVWANNASTMRPTGTPLVSNNTGGATNTANQQVLISTTGTLLPGVLYWVGAKFTGTLPTVVMAATTNTFVAALTGDGLPGATAQNAATGWSAPDAYANNIASLDLTSATFTRLLGSGAPLYLLGT